MVAAFLCCCEWITWAPHGPPDSGHNSRAGENLSSMRIGDVHPPCCVRAWAAASRIPSLSDVDPHMTRHFGRCLPASFSDLSPNVLGQQSSPHQHGSGLADHSPRCGKCPPPPTHTLDVDAVHCICINPTPTFSVEPSRAILFLVFVTYCTLTALASLTSMAHLVAALLRHMKAFVRCTLVNSPRSGVW